MKNVVTRFTLTVLSLLLVTTLSFAADAKKTEKKAETKPAAEKSAAAPKDATKKDLVDLNSATEAELKAVAGIGDTYAAKIVAGRPYANKTQLKSRKILPGPVYEKVKEQIIAKQAPGKDAAAKPATKDAAAKPVAKDTVAKPEAKDVKAKPETKDAKAKPEAKDAKVKPAKDAKAKPEAKDAKAKDAATEDKNKK